MSEEIKNTEMVAAEEKAVAPKKFKKVSRKKICGFCADKLETIDYKDITRLRKYITGHRVGNSAKNDRR